MNPSLFILHDKSSITNCATAPYDEGSGKEKNEKKDEGKQGEAFTRISLFYNQLGQKGEEVKAKIKKTADARVREREQNSPNATTHSTIGARSTRLARKGQTRTAICQPYLSNTKTQVYSHNKKQATRQKSATKTSRQKDGFQRKTVFSPKSQPSACSPLIRRRNPTRPQSQFAPQRTGQRNNAFFSTPSIHPDT